MTMRSVTGRHAYERIGQCPSISRTGRYTVSRQREPPDLRDRSQDSVAGNRHSPPEVQQGSVVTVMSGIDSLYLALLSRDSAPRSQGSVKGPPPVPADLW